MSWDMTGLAAYKSYKVYVMAYDESGNTSLLGDVVTFTTTANPLYPIVSYTRDSNYGVADQPLTIQLHDSNVYPSTFSLVSGPAGMTIDPATGLVNWTPSHADVGQSVATFRATNEHGTRDLILGTLVYFTGPVLGVGVTDASTAGATISWTPPTDTSRVAGYKIYLSWSVGGRTRGYRTYDSPGGAASFRTGGLVGGSVLFRVRVVAYNALGHEAVPGPSVTFIT